MTSTAILPVHGHSLFAEASRFLMPAAQAAGAAILNLLRMSGGMNSVDPALFAERIVQD